MSIPVTVFGQAFRVPDNTQTSAGFHLGRFFAAVAQGAGTVKAAVTQALVGATNNPQTISDSGSTFVNTTATNAVLTLPTGAAAAAGVQYIVVQQNTGTVQVVAPTGKISGPANAAKTTVTTNAASGSFTVQCVDGSNWIVISQNVAPTYA